MLPPDHPLRVDLNNEVHARPTEGLSAPAEVLYLVLPSIDAERRDNDWREARLVFEVLGHPLPSDPSSHHAVSIGPIRLVMERHSEFIRYTVIAPIADAQSATHKSILDQLGRLSGQLIVATRVTVADAAEMPEQDHDKIAAEHFDQNIVVGSFLAEGAARAFTDFRIKSDGCSRIVFIADGMRPRQSGRMVQRLLEIDTYRMMALLALPLARALRPQIEAMDRDLADITSAIALTDPNREAELLERLTRLEAKVQRALGESHYRFSASAAYRDLVEQRIRDLRENRIEGLQTFHEFTARRLSPAMNTCQAVATSLRDLSLRIAQTTDLLATRVEIAREQQNRQLLATTARRVKLQLRMQRTVEGLSIVAISYYLIGLLSYVIKGAKGAGIPLNVDIATAALVPVIVLAVRYGLRRLVPDWLLQK